MSGFDSLMLGVLVERRESASAWQRWLWRPAAVVAWSRGNDHWRKLRDDGREAVFHAGHLPLTLYRDEAEAYLQNVRRACPQLYVVVRPGDETHPGQPVRPILVTASPDEAAAYSEAEDGVYPVPMPAAVLAWVRQFVETTPRPEPFVRRNRREREEREAEARPRSGGSARQRPAWQIPGTS